VFVGEPGLPLNRPRTTRGANAFGLSSVGRI